MLPTPPATQVTQGWYVILGTWSSDKARMATHTPSAVHQAATITINEPPALPKRLRSLKLIRPGQVVAPEVIERRLRKFFEQSGSAPDPVHAVTVSERDFYCLSAMHESREAAPDNPHPVPAGRQQADCGDGLRPLPHALTSHVKIRLDRRRQGALNGHQTYDEHVHGLLRRVKQVDTNPSIVETVEVVATDLVKVCFRVGSFDRPYNSRDQPCLRSMRLQSVLLFSGVPAPALRPDLDEGGSKRSDRPDRRHPGRHIAPVHVRNGTGEAKLRCPDPDGLALSQQPDGSNGVRTRSCSREMRGGPTGDRPVPCHAASPRLFPASPWSACPPAWTEGVVVIPAMGCFRLASGSDDRSSGIPSLHCQGGSDSAIEDTAFIFP
jgi:hypothetical protein